MRCSIESKPSAAVSKRYNTRFAPAPTGLCHIGSARTAYFNYLAARASGGRFILRYDDTNPKLHQLEHRLARNDSMSDIYGSLAWLGLTPDKVVTASYDIIGDTAIVGPNRPKGPFLFEYAAMKLCEIGLAEHGEERSIMFRPTNEFLRTIPEIQNKCWIDTVIKSVPVNRRGIEALDGLPLIRKNGWATYNWSSICSDAVSGVNYVIRGVDHISNTFRQIVLFHALKLVIKKKPVEIPEFAHVGLVCDQNGEPLSKSKGASSIRTLKDQGFDREAVLNTLLRLGWGPTIDDKSTSLIPKLRAVEMFLTEGKMKSSPAKYDVKKLQSYDRKYKARLESKA